MRSARYGKGICPKCGVRPAGPMGYCRECHNRYEKERARRRRYEESRRCPAREVVYDPPGDEWDIEMLRALVEVLRRIEIRIERRPSGQIRRVLIYRGKALRF